MFTQNIYKTVRNELMNFIQFNKYILITKLLCLHIIIEEIILKYYGNNIQMALCPNV